MACAGAVRLAVRLILEGILIAMDSTGVLRSTITITRGGSISTVVYRISSPSGRISISKCVQFGFFNNFSI